MLFHGYHTFLCVHINSFILSLAMAQKFITAVFGWLQESFSGIEQGPAHALQAGYRKGKETAAQNLVFNVTNLPGTASMCQCIRVNQ